ERGSPAAFSADGRRVVTASRDRARRLWDVVVWDAETGAELRRFATHEDYVWSAGFSPDGRHVLTAGEDGTARVWDAATGAELRRLDGHEGVVAAATFSPDGRHVLTSGWDGTVRLWEAASGRELVLLMSYRDGGWAAVAPDGRFDT